MPSTRTVKALVLAVLGAIALVLGLGLGSHPAEAFPFPVPVYQIIATSGSHTASLLNLPLGQPGLPQVPMPVDVDGDLLPDVLMSVNLIEIGGLINNPPNPAAILQPNVQIDRMLTAPILGQSSPPLRIEAKLRLIDLGGSEPDTFIRFGYDTGPGGTIPPTFKGTLGGLPELFNPLSATVDTGPSAGRPVSYDGPLEIVANIATGDSDVDLDFGFSPFPHQLKFTYADDEAGQHLTYAHSAPREVDLRAEVEMTDADSELRIDAKVERLPGQIAVDIADGGSDSGAIAWASDSDGRRPDVDVHLESASTDGDPLIADIDLESLPQSITAAWSLPPEDQDGPTAITFDASGQGIGGVDVDIRNHEPDAPFALSRFVPTAQQFLSIDQAAGPDGSTLQRISGRVERVRHVEFDDTGADGVDGDGRGLLSAEVAMGDGALPLQVSYDCRVECSEDGTLRTIDVDATVAPLPDEFSMTMQEAGEDNPIFEPMVITYDASQPTDVEADLELIGGDAPDGAACGDLDTTCADLQVRDVPTQLEAVVFQGETETESLLGVSVELGAGPAPDVAGEVILGPSELPGRPTIADLEAIALPPRSTILVHQTIDPETEETRLDQARFQSCFVDDDTDPCPEGTGIGVLEVGVRNHVERPDDFPIAPTPDAPTYANVTVRGDDLALAARFADLRRVDLVDNGSILGLRTHVGDGSEPFALALDMEGSPMGDDVELGEDDEGDPIIVDDATLDLAADAVITNLPSAFELCMRSPNEPLLATGEPFTTTCEDHPFDDDDAQPMAIAFDLDASATVTGSFSRRVAGTIEGTSTPHSESIATTVDIPTLPERVSAHILTPPPNTDGATHAVYDSNQPIDELTLDFQSDVNDSVCLDPREEARALCAHARVTDIPAFVELRYDPTAPDDNLWLTTHGVGPFLPLVGPTVHDLSLTRVAPDVETGEQSALIVEGSITDVPPAMHGTLVLPPTDDDPAAILVCSAAEPCGPDASLGQAIGHVALDVTNVVAADPTPLGDDDPANDLPIQRQPLPDPTHHIALYQRGDAFHAAMALSGIRAGGYQTVTEAASTEEDEDGLELTGTRLLSVDLDTDDDQVIRGYADLDSGTSHLIADATLQDVPAATAICIRAAKLHPDDPALPPDPDDPDGPNGPTPLSFCDTRPTDDEGAFQLITTPGPDPAALLDADVFIRQSTGGGADVLAARARLTDIPSTVQGTFPARGHGSLDVRGYDGNGAPDGFAEIDAEVATFDLRAGIEGDGYPVADTPFERKDPPTEEHRAPVPAAGRQHLALIGTNDEINARARIFGLQQLALRDGVCGADAVDPGAVRFDTRADHPIYPQPGSDEEHPYQCIRTVVQEGAGQPMDLLVKVQQADDTLLALDEAELTAVPAAMEVTIANGPNVSGSGERRALCPEHRVLDGLPNPEEYQVDPTCLPPLIRFDQSGPPAQIVGRLRMGTLQDLTGAEGIIARGNALDQARFADVQEMPSATGVRAVIGLYGDDEDTRPGIVGRFRFDVPWSLQVEQPVVESGIVPGGKWTDVRFRYVVRDAADHVAETIGDMKLLLEQINGAQVLVSGDDDLGFAIPGEVAIALYLRDDEADGRTFLQLDGTVSAELNASVVLLNRTEPVIPPDLAAAFGIDPTPGIDRMAFQLLGLPSAAFTSFEQPGFRTQVELIDHPMPTTFPVYGDPPPEDNCTTIDCETSQTVITEVRAALDFDPAGGTSAPARMVRAVVDTRDQTRAELRAYQSVDALPGADGDAEIDAQANISIDPLSFYIFKGIPFLGNLEVDLDMSLEAAVTIDNASRFLAGFNAVHVEAEHDGSGTQSAIGPISLIPRTIFAGVQGPLNVTVAGLEYTGGLFAEGEGEPLPLHIPECSAFDLVIETISEHFDDGFDDAVGTFLGLADVGAYGRYFDDEINAVILPDIESGPFETIGLGSVTYDLLEPFVDDIACAATDVDLGQNLVNATTPADPLGVNLRAVPPGLVEDPPVPPGPTPAPPPLDAVLGPDTPPMCGAYDYGTLTITGPITVSGEVTDSCPAGQQSSLRLNARDLVIAPGGSIDASGIVGGGCDPGSVNYAFPDDRSPLDSIDDCAAYLASNAGAPHVQDGGSGGSDGVLGQGPDAYAGGGLFGIFHAGGTSEAGWRGGGENGGLGGGVIALSAEHMEINGDLLANGTDGTPASACAGGGGGSGGSIVIDAPVVQFAPGIQVRADGGDGALNGGGGGSAGTVLVSGGILGGFESVAASVTPGLGAGDGAEADCFAGGDPTNFFGGDPEVHVEHDARTNLLALGDFWQTTSLPDDDDDDDFPEQVAIELPFTAAAAPRFDGEGGNPYAAGNDVGYQVVLCRGRFEIGFTDYQDGLTRYMPWIETAFPVDQPCGLSDPDGPSGLAPPQAFYENWEVVTVPAGSGEVRAAEAMTLNYFAGNGYHGLFTRTFVTDVPGNDCFDDQPDALFDTIHCAPAEELPDWDEGAPELIIGIDNIAPDVDIAPILPASQIYDEDPNEAPPAMAYTNSRFIRATVTANDAKDNVLLSGLAPDGVICYWGSELRATPCDGTEPWEGGSGTGGQLTVVATDRLGHVGTANYLVELDEQGPTVQIEQLPRAGLDELENGWYDMSPNFRLFDYDDTGLGGAPPHPDGAFEYQVDGGQVHRCDFETVECFLDEQHLPGPGRHRIYYSAIDMAGNRSTAGWFFEVDPAELFSVEVKVDDEAPISAAYAAPLTPPGANGWYDQAPWVGVVGYDPPVGGSGFGPIEGEVLEDPTIPFLRYSVDGASPVDWVDPFTLGDGVHVICTTARDVAGNPGPDPAETCTPEPIRVDTVAPTVSVLSAPAAPGPGGWYTGPVTIAVGANDGSGAGSSGVDPALAPSGVFVSIDGGPYLPDSGPVTLDEGEHVVRAYAVDVAGNRSDVAERVVLVDRSRPVSSVRTTPPAPARNGWYRTPPTITLKATDGDENAGVASIRWCLGAGCIPSLVYAGPFRVPAGTTVVRWRALDVSGPTNNEPIRELVVKADDGPPIAQATLPSPILWSRLLGQLGLGPAQVGLKWTVGDDRSGPVRVQVVVFDTLGTAVRRLDAGIVHVPPGGTVSGQTMWNGQNDTLSALVPLGVYHYRVVVTDDAGNVAESGESRLITINLL